MHRRALITGLTALIAAPAVVRASSLMPIKGERYFVWQYRCPILPDIGWRWEQAFKAGISFDDYARDTLGPNGRPYEGTWTFFGKDRNIYTDEQIAFSKREYPAWDAALS